MRFLTLLLMVFSVNYLSAQTPELFPENGLMPAGWIQSSGTDASWEVDTTEASQGSSSLTPSTITHDQVAAIEYTGNFLLSNVTFSYKVSSEIDFDYLRFYIDGVEQGAWSGEAPWTTVSIPISAGTHTVKWEYSKDGSVSEGQDRAWIDEVVLPVGSIFAYDYVYQAIPNATYSISAPGVLTDALDAEGDALTAILVAGPSLGTLTFNTDGSFDYTPDDPTVEGWDYFTYKATDGANESNVATVLIHLYYEVFPEDGTVPAGWVQTPATDAAWEVSNSEASEGMYSLVSTVITDSQVATIEHTGTFQQSTLSFSFKVSSESAYDYLRFYIDGVQQGAWSGEVPWANVSFPISAGTHTVKWEYSKDGSVSEGQDRAWIDEVVLPVGNVFAQTEWYLVEPDTTRTVAAPGVLANDDDADGDALSTVLITNPQHGTLTLNSDGSFNFVPDTAYVGSDSFKYKATDGTNESNITRVDLYISQELFPEDGVMPLGWVQTTGTDNGWEVSPSDAIEGLLSLTSSVIDHSQTAAVEFTGTFNSSNVTFNCKTSCEAVDFLRFYIDGVQQGVWSGEIDWSSASYPITAGEHTIKWEYSKDGSVNEGQDRAWIDNVSLSLDKPIIISEAWASPSVIGLSESTTLGVVASDNIPASLVYDWSKVSGPGTVTFSPNGTGASDTTTATFSAAGTYVVMVTVSNQYHSTDSQTTVTVSEEFTVTYEGNLNDGGSAPVDSTVYLAGETVTVLSQNTLSRTGYTFSGWNTLANGGGTSYAPGNTFTINSDTTLHAQWVADQYTVTYEGNLNDGGSAPVDATLYGYGDTVTVMDQGSLTRSGYNFTGWNTLITGDGTAYNAGDTFAINGNVTLFAQWTRVARGSRSSSSGCALNATGNPGLYLLVSVLLVVLGGARMSFRSKCQ